MAKPIFRHPLVLTERLPGRGGTVGPSGPPVTISPTAPPAPAVGDLWWRTTDGVLYVWYDDGTSAQWVPASPPGAAGPRYYLLAGALSGQPTASALLGSWIADLAFTLPAGLAGSSASAHVAAAGTTAYNVMVNGTVQGTINWAAGATVGTFTWASAVSIAVGDRVDVYAQATVDTALSDPVWTLRGNL